MSLNCALLPWYRLLASFGQVTQQLLRVTVPASPGTVQHHRAVNGDWLGSDAQAW